MIDQRLSFSFTLFSLMFSVLSVSNQDSNIYVQCSQLYFDSMTPYESNVNLLFTSLVNSATISNFNKFEVSHDDVIYGLFQCQGDLIKSSGCKDCVTKAVNQLKTTCRVSTSATIQLEECFVKYDNKSFFGADDKMEVLKRCGPSVGYNSDVLNHINDAMAYLVTGNGQYFHGGEFGSIQGVAQCVQDVSLSNCQDCLLEASARLRSECETSIWGDMFLGKCYIRYVDRGDDGQAYDSNVGYNNNNSDNHGSDHGENIKLMIKVIGYIAAAVVGGGVTLAVTVSVTNYKKKEKKGIAANKQVNPTLPKDHGKIKIIHQFQGPSELIKV